LLKDVPALKKASSSSVFSIKKALQSFVIC